MKAFFLNTLLLFMLYLTSYTQSYSVRWGEEMKAARGAHSTLSMIGPTAEAYHTFSSSKKGRTLQSYSWNHRLVHSQPISFGLSNEDQFSLKHFLHTHSGTLGVFTREDSENRERHTYLSRLEEDSLTTPQLIHSKQGTLNGATSVTSDGIMGASDPMLKQMIDAQAARQ